MNFTRLASAVASDMKWDIGKALEFSADLLTNCNEHQIALALRFLLYCQYDKAMEAIRLTKELDRAGEMTGPLRHWATDLEQQLKVIEDSK